MCSTPMYILQKSQNVHMFAPPQLIVRSNRQEIYILIQIVDPKLSNQEVLVMRLGLNDV